MKIDAVDVLVTKWSDRPGTALALVNKHPSQSQPVNLSLPFPSGQVTKYEISGKSKVSYNDVGRNEVEIQTEDLGVFCEGMEVVLKPHSVTVIQIAE